MSLYSSIFGGQQSTPGQEDFLIRFFASFHKAHDRLGELLEFEKEALFD
jgi:hypothetical protein